MHRRDEGFILVDALLATALLAFAGAAILTIVMSSLDRQRDDLDRSVALVNMQSLTKQFLLLGPERRDQLSDADELFTYSITRSEVPIEGTTALSRWRIVATPRVGGDALDIDFLAPSGAL